MSRIPSMRPSPAMVVALLALLVALGGSAYAASKIGTKEIRRGAVTAAKLRPGAVTAGKIRAGAVGTQKIAPDAVTGGQVLESSLGTVPRAEVANRAELAARAEQAASATIAQSAATASEFQRYFASGVVRAEKGESLELASVGPFTIRGLCIDEGGIARRSRVVIETSQPHSFLFSATSPLNYTEGGFEPGIAAEIGDDIADDEPGWRANVSTSLWTAASADGLTVLRGAANTGVYVFGAECAFDVSFTNEG